MKTIKVVIGKNFGDEGKGAAVNRLCQGKTALVVRHNGGAQAGHTVEQQTFRFVFHQLGSGSLQGCPTYWSKTFLPDLLKLGEEVEDFCKTASETMTTAQSSADYYRTTPNTMTAAQSSADCSAYGSTPVSVFRPIIYADPDCACVTIYDVLLNSLREELRGAQRHGSCGMGIFEAVLRTNNRKHALFLRDFHEANLAKIVSKLRSIRDGYTSVRLAELQANDPEQFLKPEIHAWEALIWDENVLCNAAEEMLENYRKYVIPASWKNLWKQYNTIIFENAQGLMLDWDNEEYSPHLTASHTGLKNVAALLQETEESIKPSECHQRAFSMEIIYVSRTYMTRHGAGRLDYECSKEEINPQMTDLTNLPNPWQGSLRYAKHPSGDAFFHYIRQDLNFLPETLHPLVTLQLTHLDETQGNILFSDGTRTLEEFAAYCEKQAPKLLQKIETAPRYCS